MKQQPQNLDEPSNTLNPPSTGAKASTIPTPRQDVRGQVAVEPSIRTEHKENTND
jgi:hypothetical protein